MTLLAQASSQTTTPWWGVPVVAGAFTIFGVLVAQATSVFTDRRSAIREDKRRADIEAREDKRRWDNEIRDACVSLIVASGTLQIKRRDWKEGDEWPNDEAVDRAGVVLDLVATEDIVHAGNWYVLRLKMLFDVIKREGDHGKDLVDAVMELEDARAAFLNDVRAQLGRESVNDFVAYRGSKPTS